MDNLTARNKDLIKIMLNEEEYKPMSYYSSILNVSPRTLYSDINAINCYINEFKMEVDRRPGQGIKLIGDLNEKIELLHSLNSSNEKEQSFSTKERQLEIVKLLLLEEKTISYQKLSDYFLVSKTSIAKDMELIGSYVSEETVIIQSNKKGTKIIGSEVQKQYSLKKYTNILMEENNCFGEEDFFKSAPAVLKKIYPAKIVDISFKLGNEIETKLNISLSDYYLKSLIITLIILIFRISKRNHIYSERNFVFEEIKTLETYIVAKNILEVIAKELNISFSETDIDYLNRQLMAHGLKPKLKNETETKRYKKIVKDMVKEMSEVMHVDLTRDEKLLDGIMFHLIPMEYRLKMGIRIQNPLLSEIKSQYSVTFSATWYVMAKVESELNITLTEDEVAFIMVHFQAAIDRNTRVKKILIVCPTGIGSSELIANKIKRFLPAQDIVEVVPMRKIYENDIENVDLIISSVHLDITKKPIIYVSPLVTNIDLKNISNFYADIFYKENDLGEKIEQYNFKYIPQILDKEMIFVDKDYNSKEECLFEMIRAMEEKDIVYEGFKESILERERLGTTSLESGAAIPHASPETVKESRIAIMTLGKFIRWDNKYVNTIILICIANKDMHKVKSILSEIYQIVETKDTISHLLVGKKEKEIIELLGGAASD